MEKERMEEMNKFRQNLQRFMYGRYGLDQFGRFLFTCFSITVILNAFLHSMIFFYLEIALFIYQYFRIFSKNHGKRYQENAKFLEIKNKVLRFSMTKRREMEDRRYNHIYSCPSCKQKIRIPRGKGKIEITCPKCHTKFIKKS